MKDKLNPAAIMQARMEHHKASMLKPFVGRKQNHSFVVDHGAPYVRSPHQFGAFTRTQAETSEASVELEPFSCEDVSSNLGAAMQLGKLNR